MKKVNNHSCWLGCTVEPPNKGHVGTSHFVLCREVVLSSEIKNVLVLKKSVNREVISIVSFFFFGVSTVFLFYCVVTWDKLCKGVFYIY